MRALSDRARPDSESNIDGKDSDFDPTSEWETEIKPVFPEVTADKLIKIACEKLSLKAVFKFYNVRIVIEPGPSGWTQSINCPFKDHSDSTPSFGYHVSEDRFYCLGCERGGRSVHFISIMENKSVTEVAKTIILQYSQDEISEIVQDNSPDVNVLLLEFSDVVRNYLRSSNDKQNAISNVEKVTWVLDVYMEKYGPGDVNFKNLRVLLDKLIDRLNE